MAIGGGAELSSGLLGDINLDLWELQVQVICVDEL